MKVQDAIQFRCSTADEATLMVKSLLNSQVHCRDIEVLSSEPIPEVETLLGGKSRLPIFVITGAFLGIVAGFLLASVTARLYPINTGGMPIVSLLPAGIVTYESMMLLAILFGLAGFLIEARLLRNIPIGQAEACNMSDSEVLVLARVSPPKTAEELRAACISIGKSNH